MANSLYLYDNNTGIDIPVKFGNFEATVLLGKTLNELKDQISKKSIGFCVFTNITGVDYIVPTVSDKEYLSNILDSHLLSGNIEVKESSMWYSNNANKNIIINPSNKDESTIRTILIGYFGIISNTQKSITAKNVTEYSTITYSMINTRNNKILLKGTRLDLLKSVCDKSPCASIIDDKGNIVYRTKFAKATIPTGNPKAVEGLKSIKDTPSGKASKMLKIYV